MELNSNAMAAMEQFLQEAQQIPWFSHSSKAREKYYIIYSIFEAYDDWNEQMLKTWEPHIFSLEDMAVKQIGNAQIDHIFSIVSSEIGDIIWKKWEHFITVQHLEDETGLENEMLDMVKRDIAWAYIEKILDVQGFFNTLLGIYKDGYFPCAWVGVYPDGQAVVL